METERLTAPAAEAYIARFRRVLDYIDEHLDADLNVEALSRVAAFSKYHFHRQFSELFGIGVYRYIQLARLKRASYQLAFRGESRIIDIALASGYDSHEAFSRAFKKTVGQTPSEFRDQPQWASWHDTYERLSQLRSLHMPITHHAESVQIVDFKQTRVAAIEHRGDPRLIGDSIRKFIEWRKQNNLPPRVSATFNILFDDPAEIPAEDFRMDICAATERPIEANAYGIIEKTIPGGRCAVLRHVGSDDTLGDSVRYLYAEWLPASGEDPGDFPLYVQRVRFFPDVPEHEAVTDIFLPLR